MSVRHKVALVAVLALIAALVVGLRGKSSSQVVFLAVGQGDATLLRSKGRAVLFDTGPEGSAERVVVRELKKMGVTKLDMILLSHPDADHIAGLPMIVAKLKVAKVVAPEHFRNHPDLVQTLAEAKIGPERMAWLAGPSQARVGDFALYMDCPPWQDGIPDNDGSMMAKAVAGAASVTLTGDAGFTEEVEMMTRGVWTAQILKLGHHGSRYSTGDSWLDHVRPQIAVVSCGRDNSYGHPAAEVLQKCASRGIQVVRTDRQGTLVYEVRDGRFVLAP